MRTRRKIAIYQALIESKLFYTLCCLMPFRCWMLSLRWFSQSLFALYSAHPGPYLSRISNAEVLRRSNWIVLFYCRQLLKWFSSSNCYCSASHPMKQKTSICGTAQPATGRKKLGIGWIVVLSNDRRRDAGQIWTKPIGLVTDGPITLVCPRTGRMTVWWSEWQRPQRECPQHFSAFARNIGHRRR